ASLYHFHRNTSLNANEFFNNSTGIPRPKFIYNNFGGAIGGPIRRNRTFFFASYSGLRTRQDVSRTRLVLTPEAKTGLFRWRTPGGIQSFNVAANDPRGKGIDPQIARELALLPEPNTVDHPMADGLNRAGFRFNNPAGGTLNVVNGRIDHSIGERLHLFLRWTRVVDPRITDILNLADATFPGQPQGILAGSNRGFAIGANWTLSPRAIADLRVGRQSVAIDFQRPARLAAPMIVANAWTNRLNPDFGRGRSTTITSTAATLAFVRANHT